MRQPSQLRVSVSDLAEQAQASFGFPAEALRSFVDAVVGTAHEISFADAGLVLLSACLDQSKPVQSVDTARRLLLAGGTLVQVGGGLEPFSLPPQALAEHPLFAQWVAPTLGEFLGDHLRAGAIWSQLQPGAPMFGDTEITDFGGGLIGATAALDVRSLVMSPLRLTLQYGGAARPALRRSLTISGEALIGLGSQLPICEPVETGAEIAQAMALSTSTSTSTQSSGVTLH